MGSLYITCYKYLTPPESLLPRTHGRLKDVINPIERKHGNKLNPPNLLPGNRPANAAQPAIYYHPLLQPQNRKRQPNYRRCLVRARY